MNKTVRKNLMADKNYTPYCGDWNCKTGMPRTKFNKSLNQFFCSCGWVSKFTADFINDYRKKHKI